MFTNKCYYIFAAMVFVANCSILLLCCLYFSIYNNMQKKVIIQQQIQAKNAYISFQNKRGKYIT